MPLLIANMPRKLALQQAEEILVAVGLQDRLQHKSAQMSGGERQRTAIARALVTKPGCLLADEPTGNLDQETAEHIYQLMLELNQQLQASLLIVTHDIALAQRMQRILTIKHGHLTETKSES
jgi:lipoprotein-releasing system ATP-binding protein